MLGVPIVIGLLLGSLAIGAWAQTRTSVVLFLHSYDSTYRWTRDLDRGITEALAPAATRIAVRVEYLDARNESRIELHNQLATLLAKKYRDTPPRLIVATHHDAVGGPYHRNDRAIADVMKAFRGDEQQAHRIIAEYRSDYLLICPNMSTATIFMSEAPNGFYGQLIKGKVPAWLEPVELPKDSPFKMWRVVG